MEIKETKTQFGLDKEGGRNCFTNIAVKWTGGQYLNGRTSRVKMQTGVSNGHGKWKVFSFTSKQCTYIINVYSSLLFTYLTCISFPSDLRSVSNRANILIKATCHDTLGLTISR
jgi:hypothetical protein